jgi:glycosyltransferase involved in cell wall biosynthesis
MISIFTPSFADEADTNAQNLSVKEIAARLDPERIRVTMLHSGVVDPSIASSPNTRLVRCYKHGNTVRALAQILGNIPDVYFFPREGPLDAAFLTFRHYLRLHTKVISYVVSGGLESGRYFDARERHIREADAVFANNRHLMKLLKERMGVAVSGVIYDGADGRYFYAPEKCKDKHSSISVLFAGSFRPLKRVPVVVQQAAQFPEAQFRIAGSGEDEQTCKTLAGKLGCKNISFLGHLSQQQLGEEMRRADIFFFPSILEGHPQVLVQAAACGLPVIAMKIYRPDYVVDGVTGLLAETDDDLTVKLRELIPNAEMRCAMGQAALAHSRKFDWDAVARNWQDAFEEVAAKRR